jgi:flagellar protein FlaG
MEVGKVNPGSGQSALLYSQVLTPQEKEQQNQLVKAVEAVNKQHLFGEYNELTFSYDRNTGKSILRIVNTKTKEVVRQIPAEYLLRLAEDLMTNSNE